VGSGGFWRSDQLAGRGAEPHLVPIAFSREIINASMQRPGSINNRTIGLLLGTLYSKMSNIGRKSASYWPFAESENRNEG
jgi:hypothetical protein